MCAEGITLFDGSRESRADDRSTDSRIGGSPLEWIGLDAMLVRVGCYKMSSVRCHASEPTPLGGCTCCYANKHDYDPVAGLSGYQTRSGCTEVRHGTWIRTRHVLDQPERRTHSLERLGQGTGLSRVPCLLVDDPGACLWEG